MTIPYHSFCKSRYFCFSLYFIFLICPYILLGKTLESVKLELAKEAEAKAKNQLRQEEAGEQSDSDSDSDEDHFPNLDTSPGDFLCLGLEIEQQQYVFRLLSSLLLFLTLCVSSESNSV
jgi:hypothetical protein